MDCGYSLEPPQKNQKFSLRKFSIFKYSRKKSLYIAWASFRNVKGHTETEPTLSGFLAGIMGDGGINHEIGRVMKNPTFCICENKGADQLCRNCEADQRLCFRDTDSTVPLLSKSKISSL